MKELEDYAWFPEILRRQQTAYIGWMVRLFRVYRKIPGLMKAELPARALQHIQDFGSGSGGPVQQLCMAPELRRSRFTLSDLYPVADIPLPDNCIYLNYPVDALHFRADTGSTLTFFNTFHHFSSAEQEAIIREQGRRGHCLLIAEILTPDLLCSLRILLATTIGQMLFAPFVKPFSLLRIFLTWLLPINLITITWDGLISVWKSPGIQRRRALEQYAQSLGMRATWHKAGSVLLPVQVLICIPEEKK
jgi:hypothetical protein